MEGSQCPQDALCQDLVLPLCRWLRCSWASCLGHFLYSILGAISSGSISQRLGETRGWPKLEKATGTQIKAFIWVLACSPVSRIQGNSREMRGTLHCKETSAAVIASRWKGFVPRRPCPRSQVCHCSCLYQPGHTAGSRGGTGTVDTLQEEHQGGKKGSCSHCAQFACVHTLLDLCICRNSSVARVSTSV